ncbi:flagellar filament capping protein FliD [Rugamonas apoptosis]|uniref:Flagellar hook-associated protein 2 n=1 Tax=Rugamonas apoptosis TaxID=2758570 RepID=A0A7W2ILN7_9BURK|nr:flagellar filament capping protein FliD [Rugamonas apoptosis]MBA5688818.1 flagellar filament capping protein FliD [Rugamonas apoptosis]
MSAISSPNYDPVTTATNLATSYIAGNKAILDDQTSTANATASALSSLSTAMGAFQTAISGLASVTTSVMANSATFSSAVGTASANASAVAGTYSFYVQQLATAGQVSYGNVADSTAAGAGALNVTLADGTSFQIDLANADTNHDNILSAKEVAAAINIAAGNNSRVTASTLNVNGQPTLVLSANQTGAANAVSLDVSGVNDPGLKAALGAGNQKTITAAQDAIVWIGAQGTGTKVQQTSNTYNLIDNVSMTFTKAQAVGETPVTLTVGNDPAATKANVQSFVDAYNKLNTVLNSLTQAADKGKGVASGPFAADAGVAALRSRMVAAVRTLGANGQSLVAYGITAQRDGSLALDSSRLSKAIAATPTGLDSLFGRVSGAAGSGALGALNKVMDQWTNSATGQIGSRKTSVTKLQAALTDRQATLQTQYDSAYKRYLGQFTALQQLQSQMTNNSNLFTALFSSNSSNS